ncbi:MAG: CapA family protein [Polyangiaceae bacterium]|nr:CapA family protein [Polyangiaceae bacterium]
MADRLAGIRGNSTAKLVAAAVTAVACVAFGAYLLTRPRLATPEALARDVPSLRPGQQSIVLVGDVMPWDRAAPYLEQHGAGYPYRSTLPLLRGAGLAVLNLEGPVAKEAPKAERAFSYRIPPWTLAGMVEAGFDAVSLANNHALDCGPAGLAETLARLAAAKLGVFGAGLDPAEAYSPRVLALGQLRIALIGFVAPETMHFDSKAAKTDQGDVAATKALERSLGCKPGRPGVAVLTRERLLQAVEKARTTSDLVVLFVHWGIRYRQPPSAYQRELAHAAIDAGVDLVVGHHAHTWQPIERHRNRAIVYGLGNFAFGSKNRRAREGLVVRAIVEGHAVTRLEVYPLYTLNRDARVSYQPKVMAGSWARSLLERLAQASRSLGASVEIVGGHGVVSLAATDS